MSTRAYDSSRRRTAAAETQARVIEQATQLLVQRGYAGTTVADIAEAAQVSVPLVYASFGNKAGLLKRVLDVAIAGDNEPVALRDRPDVAAVKAATSARRRCDLTAALVAGVHRRTAGIFEVLRDAAGTDAEVATALTRGEQGRRIGMGEFVEVLASNGQLRANLDPDHATDVVWALTDPATYHRLVVQRGWEHAQYEEWLGRSIYDGVARGAPRPAQTAGRPTAITPSG
jgi:AcrR family transcriptional regulator